MDGSMDGRADGWMDGSMWLHGLMMIDDGDGPTMGGWKYGSLMDRWMDRQLGLKLTGGCMQFYMYIYIYI